MCFFLGVCLTYWLYLNPYPAPLVSLVSLALNVRTKRSLGFSPSVILTLGLKPKLRLTAH